MDDGVELYRVAYADESRQGGWIESHENLADSGRVWDNAIVRDEAQVYGRAEVSENAQVIGAALVYNQARVSGNAQVCDDAEVYGNARVEGNVHLFDRVRVFDNAQVFGAARLSNDAQVLGHAKVFDDARIYDRARALGKAQVCGKARISGKAQAAGAATITGRLDAGKVTETPAPPPAASIKQVAIPEVPAPLIPVGKAAAPSGKVEAPIDETKTTKPKADKWASLPDGVTRTGEKKETTLVQYKLGEGKLETKITVYRLAYSDTTRQGGWVAWPQNISGNARIYDDAEVFGYARVSGNAEVSGNARVYGKSKIEGAAKVSGNAEVYEKARVYDKAEVYGNARVYEEAEVFGGARSYGDARLYGKAQVYEDAEISGNARAYGNSKVYGSARVSGKAYVYDLAQICGDAEIFGDRKVYGKRVIDQRRQSGSSAAASGKAKLPLGKAGTYVIRVIHPESGIRAFYIGESVNIGVRWATHKADLLGSLYGIGGRSHHTKFLIRDLQQGAIADFFVLDTVNWDLGRENVKTEIQRIEQYYWLLGCQRGLLLLNDDPFEIDVRMKSFGRDKAHAGNTVTLSSYQLSNTANAILDGQLRYEAPFDANPQIKKAAILKYIEETRKQFGGLNFADVDESKAYKKD